MAGDFFVCTLQGWSGLLGKSTKSQKAKPILKISKAEFGLFKVLFYSSKAQNFYSIVLLQKRSPYHSILIVFSKCLVLTYTALRLSLKPQCRHQLQHTSLETYLEPSQTSAMELFCENS